MSTHSDSVSIRLTPEQQESVRRATGKTTDEITLTVEELEQRIAPSRLNKMM